MKRLFLVRHAKSSWTDASLSDHDRPLNKRGQRDAPRMGKRLKAAGHVPDSIVASSARRALATARIVADRLGYPCDGIVVNRELYAAGPATILDVARRTDNALGSVMLFGHNPGFTELASSLAGVAIDNIPTCGVFCADFAVDSWAALTPGTGTFVFFDYPKRVQDQA